MKINHQKYAEVLYALVKGKKKEEIPEILRSFLEFLNEKGALNKIEKIIGSFAQIWNQKENSMEAEVFSARNLSHEALGILENYLKQKQGKEKIILKQVVKPEILGGAILRAGNFVVDASLSNHLKALRQKMTF